MNPTLVLYYNISSDTNYLYGLLIVLFCYYNFRINLKYLKSEEVLEDRSK